MDPRKYHYIGPNKIRHFVEDCKEYIKLKFDSIPEFTTHSGNVYIRHNNLDAVEAARYFYDGYHLGTNKVITKTLG